MGRWEIVDVFMQVYIGVCVDWYIGRLVHGDVWERGDVEMWVYRYMSVYERIYMIVYEGISECI